MNPPNESSLDLPDQLTADLPTFLPPKARRFPRSPQPDQPSPSPNGPGLLTPSPEPSDDSPGSPSEDPTRAIPTDGSSPGSTKRRLPGWLRGGLLDEGTRAAYQETIKTGALAGSGLIETRAGAGTGALLMLEGEADAIATPASRLAARHLPMPGGAGAATDLSDVVALIVAVGGYVIAGLARRTAAFTGGTLTLIPEPGNRNQEPEPTPSGALVPSWPAANRPPAVGLT